MGVESVAVHMWCLTLNSQLTTELPAFAFTVASDWVHQQSKQPNTCGLLGTFLTYRGLQ